MGAGNRWLLLRAGPHLLAAPLSQVERLSDAALPGPEAAPDEAVPDPLESLGLGEEPEPRVRVWVRRAGGSACVCVAAAEEVSAELEMVAMPRLLGRALGEGSAVLGAIFWQGKPVPVIDLAREAT